VIQLEDWDPNKVYDRIGMDEMTMEILGVHVPKLEIPVKPGRNLPIIIETAAMNERLKKWGTTAHGSSIRTFCVGSRAKALEPCIFSAMIIDTQVGLIERTRTSDV